MNIAHESLKFYISTQIMFRNNCIIFLNKNMTKIDLKKLVKSSNGFLIFKVNFYQYEFVFHIFNKAVHHLGLKGIGSRLNFFLQVLNLTTQIFNII